ncbi:MarR family winged helix-turn-helix transcriptional regulator [Microbacterium sp. 8M]|uniref:MarR family winged helix-turn-helix transcriptional regulator n=1 Tax=Microbacterium sp. 8M TaxID=2653153 RepID=UPI001F306BA1|nr:MarR family transcriptional regulator [Microbacterium sp. 8M]
MEDPRPGPRTERAMIDPRLIDPTSELVNREDLSDQDVDEIVEMMAALSAWHRAAERMSLASRRYMRLNINDMRAVRFLIAAENAGEPATARALAEHLGISSAATTKLLDRLEQGGHVLRLPYPNDRRALALRVSPETRLAAREGVGRLHARRFAVAARLSPSDRAIVTGFLQALAATEHPDPDGERIAVAEHADESQGAHPRSSTSVPRDAETSS